MFEELLDQRRVVLDFSQLFIDARLHLLARFERPSFAGASLGVAPHQLIGIEIRRVAGQKVHRQLAVRALHVLFDDQPLVRRQSIDPQMDRFLRLCIIFLSNCTNTSPSIAPW